MLCEKSIEGGRKQVVMEGERGPYVIREYKNEPTTQRWWAIQLFDAVGCIAGIGATPEDAFDHAER